MDVNYEKQAELNDNSNAIFLQEIPTLMLMGKGGSMLHELTSTTWFLLLASYPSQLSSFKWNNQPDPGYQWIWMISRTIILRQRSRSIVVGDIGREGRMEEKSAPKRWLDSYEEERKKKGNGNGNGNTQIQFWEVRSRWERHSILTTDRTSAKV